MIHVAHNVEETLNNVVEWMMIDQRWEWFDCDICQCWEELIDCWSSEEFQNCLPGHERAANPRVNSAQDGSIQAESRYEATTCMSPLGCCRQFDIMQYWEGN